MREHPADFILVSSSSMTSHLFVLKTEEELEEAHQSKQKESWTFSSLLLPQIYSMERSKIRLNIQEELAPPSHLSQVKKEKTVDEDDEDMLEKARVDDDFWTIKKSNSTRKSGFCRVSIVLSVWNITV